MNLCKSVAVASVNSVDESKGHKIRGVENTCKLLETEFDRAGLV